MADYSAAFNKGYPYVKQKHRISFFHFLAQLHPSCLRLLEVQSAQPFQRAMEDAPDLTRLFETLRDMDEATETGSLDSAHYRGVDVAIAEVVQQLSPMYPASSSSESDDGIEQEMKQGHSTTETAADRAAAETLQELLAQHQGPRRSMVENAETRKILQRLFPSLLCDELEEMLSAVDRREEEMQAKLDEASSDVEGFQPDHPPIQVMNGITVFVI